MEFISHVSFGRKVLLILAAFVLFSFDIAAAQTEWGEPVNLGPPINTDRDESYPFISYDGTQLFFMSDRDNSDDIYVSNWTGSEWGSPQKLNINTFQYGETSPYLTADGQQLYFVSWGRPGGYGDWDIWVSNRENGFWGAPVNAGPMINTKFIEFTIALSPDGKQMYFSSNKFIGGYTDLDLWVSTWDEAGWLYPINMGQNINGPFWEFGTSITGEGTELYFTRANFSNVPNTHDLFLSAWAGSQWQPAVKLPAPVNTDALESDPSVSADGQTLYFISDREGGLGRDDIWITQKSDTGWTEPINPGPAINSAEQERTPFITAGGDRLYFVSYRDGTDDIFYSDYVAGEWMPAIKMNSNINTDRPPGNTNNVAASELSPVVSSNGDTLHFLRWQSQTNSWHLFASVRQDTGWGKADGIGGNVSSGAWRILLHQNRLYLSLSIPGGYGDFDLWVSDWQEDGVGWGPPQNLGAEINDARTYGASVSKDGSELYYSSWDTPEGHAVDLFVSKRDSSSNWAPGQRLNINSPPDSSTVPVKAWDRFPSLSPDGAKLYFASRRDGGVGKNTEDIWVAERLVDRIEDDRGTSVVPESIELQNYPNPFNAMTTIRYMLPRSGVVTLTIYNLLGKEVITLVDAEQARGEHYVHWQGKNEQGKEVTSGVYLCALRSMNQTRTIKLLFIK